jgi:hypothetical protein
MDRVLALQALEELTQQVPVEGAGCSGESNGCSSSSGTGRSGCSIGCRESEEMDW